MTRWAMVIDLDKCVACQGCSIACRFENNTPVVAPDQALMGREILWNDVFPNAACVVSLIDRLVHHSEVIAIEGKSYRMKEAQERAAKRCNTKKRGKAK